MNPTHSHKRANKKSPDPASAGLKSLIITFPSFIF